jgi:hypothetical protein
MAEHVYPWLERCFDCWTPLQQLERRRWAPVAVAEFQAAAVPEDFIVNAWQVILV